MSQRNDKESLAAIAKNESLQTFLYTGRNNTIKKGIVLFLLKNPTRSYTASELQGLLLVKYRSSVCKPLRDLVVDELVIVAKTKYDSQTGREVSAYQIKADLV
jgi:hypothetical protein